MIFWLLGPKEQWAKHILDYLDNSEFSQGETEVMLILRETFEFFYVTMIRLMAVEGLPRPECFKLKPQVSECHITNITGILWYRGHVLPHLYGETHSSYEKS